MEDFALLAHRFARQKVAQDLAGGAGRRELALERGQHRRHLLQTVPVLGERSQLGQQVCEKKISY